MAPDPEEYIRDVYRSLTDLGTQADQTVDARLAVPDQPTQNGAPAVKVTQPGTPMSQIPAGKSYQGMAIASLVCGIVSLLIAGFILGPVAVILGLIARKRMRASNNRNGHGMALAGIIIGAIGTVLVVLIIAVEVSNR